VSLEFWVSLVAGFIGGYVVNEIHWRRQLAAQAKVLRVKFKRVEGRYDAYPFRAEEPLPDSDEVDFGRKIGDVTIRYEHDNVLTLDYKQVDGKNDWAATISMETPATGSMCWRYVRLGGEVTAKHRIGFKRCFIGDGVNASDDAATFLYLYGEKGFTREALERVGDLPASATA